MAKKKKATPNKTIAWWFDPTEAIEFCELKERLDEQGTRLGSEVHRLFLTRKGNWVWEMAFTPIGKRKPREFDQERFTHEQAKTWFLNNKTRRWTCWLFTMGTRKRQYETERDPGVYPLELEI